MFTRLGQSSCVGLLFLELFDKLQPLLPTEGAHGILSHCLSGALVADPSVGFHGYEVPWTHGTPDTHSLAFVRVKKTLPYVKSFLEAKTESVMLGWACARLSKVDGTRKISPSPLVKSLLTANANRNRVLGIW